MDRGENVVADDTFGDQDGVFEVVAVPGHEGAKNVTAEREFAQLRRRTVGNDVASFDLVAHFHQRTLRDAGALVGTGEFLHLEDINRRLVGVFFIRRMDNDTVCIDLVDDTGTRCRDRSTGVAGNCRFHTGTDQRCVGTHQRNGLTLHVRAHKRAVRVIVLEERDERSGDGHDLLRRNVDQLDL